MFLRSAKDTVLILYFFLSYSTGPIFSIFSSKSLALAHGLELCLSHLITYSFQRALFLIPNRPLRLLERALLQLLRVITSSVDLLD